jgi:hypothetical protein
LDFDFLLKKIAPATNKERERRAGAKFELLVILIFDFLLKKIAPATTQGYVFIPT